MSHFNSSLVSLTSNLVEQCKDLHYPYEFCELGLFIYPKLNDKSFIGSAIIEMVPALAHCYAGVDPLGRLFLCVYE